ncbi:uncharacterized protein si:ch211-139g16.8 [Neoarius graeffei]|uniref:uncharacterized protein si:ch211-139g16.8 n=1 Tax=Neoarius graeffei TaxID=443677 RepID=UPI00298CECB7|nr:uncharacterized protein si:ch211-139g16.8 [Neoarius graeffei]
MVLYLFFYIFFFTPGLSVSMCTVNVAQPQEHLDGRFNQSVNITCHVNISCPNKKPVVQWYVFTTDSYLQLDIKNQPKKYKLQGTDLHITWLSQSNNGVYYCAAFDNDSKNSGAQAIGTGTTLTVKENENDNNIGNILLIILVVLLSLYSLIILALFICIKTGRATLFNRRQTQSQSKGDSTRRVHFRVVVQELYSKRNLRRNKKNRHTEVSQENKVENPRSHTEREDVYQNLNRSR